MKGSGIFNMDIKGRQAGFTIVELVVVVALLGILSAVALPRFIGISDQASTAAVQSVGASFSTGVQLIHMKWVAEGSLGAVYNFYSIFGSGASDALSVNAQGWPADLRGVSLTMNSTNDCIDVWRSVLQSPPSISAAAGGADFQATYNGAFNCTYTYQADSSKTITYDSTNGEVVINAG